MSLLNFFSCAFAAFGPALAIFFIHIAPNAQLVILMVSSAFFWLISLLLATAVWFIAKGSRDVFSTTIIYAVLLQEIFRWLLYMLISRAEDGLNTVSKHPKSKFNRSGYAYACGLGFGIMSGSISYITMLVQTIGPGVIMCPSCPSISLYFISAVTTCLFILHHCAWMVISFTGFTRRSYIRIAWVVVSHYGASYLTLLNTTVNVKYGCAYSLGGNIAILAISAIIAGLDLRMLHQKTA